MGDEKDIYIKDFIEKTNEIFNSVYKNSFENNFSEKIDE